MQPLLESVNSTAAISNPHRDFDLLAPIDVRFLASIGMFRDFIFKLSVEKHESPLVNACGWGG